MEIFIKKFFKIHKKLNLYIDGLFYKGSEVGIYYESITKELAKRGINVITCASKRLKILIRE